MRRVGLLGVVLLGLGVAAAQAQPRSSGDWNEVKCTRYAEAWSQALGRFGREGLGAAFLDAHAAFLASGCRDRAGVCPRSPQELALADVMTVAAMNAGTASSFVPFICRD